MSFKIDGSHSKIEFGRIEMNAAQKTYQVKDYTSTLSSLESSSTKQFDVNNCIKMVVAPFIALWNYVMSLIYSSDHKVHALNVQACLTAVKELKEKFDKKEKEGFVQSYEHLNKDVKALLQNIYFKWVNDFSGIEAGSASQMDKFIKQDPLANGVGICCDKVIKNLNFMLSIQPIFSALKKGPTAEERVELVKKFDALDKDLKDGVRFTITKLLYPSSSVPSHLVEKIIKNPDADLFMNDLSTALAHGLLKTDNHRSWYLEMPSDWTARAKFTI